MSFLDIRERPLTKRPDFLKSGEAARLIPVVAESNRENRLLSPVMASLVIVPEFANAVLGRLGVRTGIRTMVQAFTEVVFHGDNFEHDRPDGLLIVDTGRREYKILIEAKAKNADLDVEQVTRYLELARATAIDAVLTISNQFTATPRHSPVQVSGRLLRKVALFHVSWSSLATSVDLLVGNDAIKDADQALVLRELQRYLSHDSAGISGFTQMNREWREVVKAVSAGAHLRKSDEGLLNTVLAWHQEQRDMCLILSRHLQTPVGLKLSKRHREFAEEWVKATIAELLDTRCLSAVIDVPDAAASIQISISLARKTITLSMQTRAPLDRKSTRARTNWLLRQIPHAEDPRLQIRLHYPGRKAPTDFELAALREKPDLVDGDTDNAANNLEVRLFDDLGGRFSGSKTFIEAAESDLITFYDQIVVGIKPWQPAAPKPVKTEAADPDPEPQEPADFPEPGDLH
jgi:hypothetical protein